MRSGWLIFSVALALFAVAVAHSPERRVAETYRAWLQAHAELDAHRICELTDEEWRRERCAEELAENMTPDHVPRMRLIAAFEVVDVDVDGDTASASLRSPSCTLTATDAEFRRTDDGDWRYRGVTLMGIEPPCEERHGVPPWRIEGWPTVRRTR